MGGPRPLPFASAAFRSGAGETEDPAARPGLIRGQDPVDEGTTRRGTDTPVHRPEKPAGSKHSSTIGLSLHEQLARQAEIHASTEDEA